MTIEEFKKTVLEMYPNAKFEEQRVIKTNGQSYDSIMVNIGRRIAPTFNKEHIEQMDEKLIKAAFEPTQKFNINKLKEASVVEQAISIKGNEEFLKTCEHRTVCDLAIIKRLFFEMNGEEVSAVCKEKDDRTPEPYILAKVREVINPYAMVNKFPNYRNALNDEDLNEDDLFVTSTKHARYGSGAIGDIEFLKKIYDRLGEFYILPSSIHELMIVKKSPTVNAEMYKTMVQEINEADVSPNDKLSDNVYIFDGNEVKIAT